MEEAVLSRIYSVMKNNVEFIDDILIEIRGAEIVFLAQYIERLEEKEQILNALLGKGANVNVVVNTQNNKEVLWKREY